MGLKIAQMAPVYDIVPPNSRTKRVMSCLTEDLVQKTYAVMFLASGDSETDAWLVTPSGRLLRLDKHYEGQTVKKQRVPEVA